MNPYTENDLIFDEGSWDAESARLIVKKEPDSSIQAEIYSERLGNKHCKYLNQEPTEQTLSEIRREDSEDGDISKFHSETNTEFNQFCYLQSIKKEPVENVQQFEGVNSGELDYLNTSIKSEFIRDESNPSSYDEELFKNYSLDDSLQTTADTSEYLHDESWETDARTVFTKECSEKSFDSSSDNTNDSEQFGKISTRDRLGPRFREDGRHDSNSILVKRILGPKIVEDDYSPRQKIRKFSQEYESDPEVLKKSDYGKNTLGYDHFMEKVPLDQRSGNILTEHWKLKLHQSGPKDSFSKVPVRPISPSEPLSVSDITVHPSPASPWSVAAQPAEIIPPPSSPRNEIPSTSDCWTTDDLIRAIRANPPAHQWSPELRDALSALRPPNRPTGPCRRRLKAFDGTSVRVWLPKGKVKPPSPSRPVAAQPVEINSPPSSPRNEIPSTCDRWTTDDLIIAVRANPVHQWSPELRDALSALRPSNCPTGRCRRRLKAADGTTVRVWLPERRVRPSSPPRSVAAQPVGIISAPSSPRNEIPSTPDRWTTDDLICAIRANPPAHQFSPELRDALSALRPPNRPTGPCRRRLKASDGTSVRVWLPPQRESKTPFPIAACGGPASRNKPSSVFAQERDPSLARMLNNRRFDPCHPSQPLSPPVESGVMGRPKCPPSAELSNGPLLTTLKAAVGTTVRVWLPEGRPIPSSPPLPAASQPVGITSPPCLPRNEIPPTSDRWTTDDLIRAIRATPSGHKLSPELRDALSALRPPNRPTGRCRQRLMAADGTTLRVCLPERRI